jgi:tetratricopeptide (TPR) repeat protein
MGMRRLFTGRTLAERYLERGLHHLDKKKYDDALADVTSAITEEPYNAELYATRGYIYLDSNQETYLDYAQADFEYAIRLDPKQWVAHYCLGMIAYAAEDYPAALGWFSTARDLAPLHPEVHYYRALCCFQLKDVSGALVDMQLALDIFTVQNDSRKGFARRWLTEFRKAHKQLKASAKSAPALSSGSESGSGRQAQRGRSALDTARYGGPNSLTDDQPPR